MKEFTYRLEDAKNGAKTIIISRDCKEFPLHSRIDPLREGEKNAPEFNPDKYDLLIVLGCGLGYHLMGLRDKVSGYKKIIVIDIIPGLEGDPAGGEFFEYLRTSANLTFITGEEPERVETRLTEMIDLDAYRGVQVVEHTGSFRLFTEYYEAVKSSVKRILDKKSGDKATVKAFGSIFLRNALNNLKNIDKLEPVSSLAGRFSGRSALIVSSAPSVEDYIDDIKKFRDRFYIIAVDSALPMLREQHIKPDFAVSIDPQHRIAEHFSGHEGRGTLHIFSIVSPPAVVERYRGYLSLNSHPVSQIIEEFYPGAVGSIDSGTGSVAGDALCFALLAGFENIGMTGFDFSFSRNIIYARGTSYQKRYSLFFNNRFVTPEGFNAAYIFKGSGSLRVQGRYTRRSFVGYRDSLVKLISERCAAPPVIINSRGIPVSNGRYMNIQGFAEIYVNSKCVHGISADNSVKLKEIIDIKRINDFLAKGEVKEELLRHSLGTETVDKRGERFFRIVSG
jgi:hypothetical protein